MARPMPVAAAFFSLFVIGSLGLPGLSGFVGEFLILRGDVPVRQGVRGARLDRRSSSAPPTCCGCTSAPCSSSPNEKWLSLKDLSAREIVTLVPLVGMAIWIGLYPHTFLNMIDAPAQNIISQVAAVPGRASGWLITWRARSCSEGSRCRLLTSSPILPETDPAGRGLAILLVEPFLKTDKTARRCADAVGVEPPLLASGVADRTASWPCLTGLVRPAVTLRFQTAWLSRGC